MRATFPADCAQVVTGAARRTGRMCPKNARRSTPAVYWLIFLGDRAANKEAVSTVPRQRAAVPTPRSRPPGTARSPASKIRGTKAEDLRDATAAYTGIGGTGEVWRHQAFFRPSATTS